LDSEEKVLCSPLWQKKEQSHRIQRFSPGEDRPSAGSVGKASGTVILMRVKDRLPPGFTKEQFLRTESEKKRQRYDSMRKKPAALITVAVRKKRTGCQRGKGEWWDEKKRRPYEEGLSYLLRRRKDERLVKS